MHTPAGICWHSTDKAKWCSVLAENEVPRSFPCCNFDLEKFPAKLLTTDYVSHQRCRTVDHCDCSFKESHKANALPPFRKLDQAIVIFIPEHKQKLQWPKRLGYQKLRCRLPSVIWSNPALKTSVKSMKYWEASYQRLITISPPRWLYVTVHHSCCFRQSCCSLQLRIFYQRYKRSKRLRRDRSHLADSIPAIIILTHCLHSELSGVYSACNSVHTSRNMSMWQINPWIMNFCTQNIHSPIAPEDLVSALSFYSVTIHFYTFNLGSLFSDSH